MFRGIIPYSCLNIDCSWTDPFKAIKRVFYTSETSSVLVRRISKLFPQERNVLVTISVRTVVDLLLQVLALPPGSEIIMSAINIPEIVRIIKIHNCVPVPVDIDINTLATSADRVEAAITPKTKLVLIASIFGTKNSLAEISKITKKHNLILFEDCAEGYCGNGYSGDPNADITSFSFGPIKTSTAFQGAISFIRNEELFNEMKTLHSFYPAQKSRVFLKKVLKYSCGKLLINSRFINAYGRKFCNKFKIDIKKYVVSMMRAFTPGQDLTIYRNQPSKAMISFLLQRIQTFNGAVFEKQMENIRLGTEILESSGLQIPGGNKPGRNYWLYPILVEYPEEISRQLQNLGIDAYKGVSQLNVVEIEDNFHQKPENAIKMFEKLIYLPIHKNIPPKDIGKIFAMVAKVIQNN